MNQAEVVPWKFVVATLEKMSKGLPCLAYIKCLLGLKRDEHKKMVGQKFWPKVQSIISFAL